MTSLVEVYRRWPTHTDCISHLEAVRWGGLPICPYCGAERVSRHRELLRDDRWQCQRCDRSFSVTVGTIFHRTHVDLQRWFLLVALMLNAKKGLSAMQAARDLEMRRPTVWSMMHRVRKALVDDGKLLTGLVEIDEAYVGGKPRKRNRRDDDTPSPRGRGTSKTPVIGAVERGGRVKAKMVAHDEMTADDMAAFVRATSGHARGVPNMTHFPQTSAVLKASREGFARIMADLDAAIARQNARMIRRAAENGFADVAAYRAHLANRKARRALETE